MRERSEAQLLAAPCSGELIALADVNDGVFSKGLLGCGFAVRPSSGGIVSPLNGAVRMAFPQGHALLLERDNLSLLIHAGIDTVNLEGEGLHPLVSAGDCLKTGQPIMEIDLATIIGHGFEPTVIVVVMDGPKGTEVRLESGLVDAGQLCVEVVRPS